MKHLFKNILNLPTGVIIKIRQFCYRFSFGGFGRHSMIYSPLHLDGVENIFIGNGVAIKYKTWLSAISFTGEKDCKLIFGDGCTIGHFNHIIATKRVELGKNVLTADKVYISDCLHGYENLDLPIRKQPIIQKMEVYIGDDSWIGENVCILGASVGKHCVVGANSVVTHCVPDYCVVGGVPAVILKRYDFEKQEWRKTDKNGNFVD